MAVKKDLVDALAAELDITKKDAASIVEANIEAVVSLLESGEDVQITGFGTFSTYERAARKGRNPQTGEEIDIPATKVAKFRSSKGLKDLIAGK